MKTFSNFVVRNESVLDGGANLVAGFNKLPFQIQAAILSGALAAGVAGANYLAPYKNQQITAGNQLADPASAVAPTMSNLGGN